MRRIPVAAAVLAAALTLTGPASAQGPLSNPPPPGGPTASTIFDAMLAIARAATSNPAAAQAATFQYQAAIQQYKIGDFDRARMSALSAIAQTMPAPLPAPSVASPSIPQPVYYQMPPLATATQADAESYVALARRSLIECGAPGATPPPAIQQQSDAANAALTAHKYDAARAAAQSVIDQCAAATAALAQGVR